MQKQVETTGKELFLEWEDKLKKCTVCNTEKPTSAFGTDGGSNYLRYMCKECARAQYKLVNSLKKVTPPPPDDHRCPVCNRSKEDIRENKNDFSGVWCLDHDHITNKFRGWICHKCNLGLGNLNDSIERLKAAIAYLTK